MPIGSQGNRDDMKTKSILTLTLLFLGISLGREAQAFYHPSTGRWLSRDPIGEAGGMSLTAFAGNNGVNDVDALGLFIELWYGNHIPDAAKTSRHSKLWMVTDEAELANANRKLFDFKPALSKTESGRSEGSDPCLWLIAMGAGPNWAIDELIAEFNRTDDVGKTLENPTLVTTFTTVPSARDFLLQVLARNKTMNQNFENTTLEYDLYPDPSYTSTLGWDEFNSNSYISGLLTSFGYATPAPNGPAPGYEKPVPTFVFTQHFLSTRELKRVWRIHYPGF